MLTVDKNNWAQCSGPLPELLAREGAFVVKKAP